MEQILMKVEQGIDTDGLSIKPVGEQKQELIAMGDKTPQLALFLE
jgi:hypothetical protein